MSNAPAQIGKAATTAFLEKAYESGEVGVVLADQDGFILDANPKFEQLMEYPAKELVGQNPRLFRSELTVLSTYHELWDTILQGQVWRGSMMNLSKSGELRFVRETIIPVQDFGVKRGYVALHVDESEVVDLQRKLVETTLESKARYSAMLRLTEDHRHLMSQVKELHHASAAAMVSALEVRDSYTAGHAWRVWKYSEEVARRLGLLTPESEWSFKAGCILHDLGKIGIPDAVLLKPSYLSPAEREMMRLHPVIGFDILRKVIHDELLLTLVRSHHERLDGSGYPDGLRGEQIPKLVRVLGLCDSFDAMTSRRAYRSAMAPTQALGLLLKDCLAGLYDEEAGNALASLWSSGKLATIYAMQESCIPDFGEPFHPQAAA